MSLFLKFIGVLVSLTASFFDALGLNIQRRDHIREASKNNIKIRHECMRPQWHLGLYLYVGSQALGSSAVVALLSPQQAAPLGALSLVFNFLFARYLVGTLISKRDLIGTVVVLMSILMIILNDICSTTLEESEMQKQNENNLDALKLNFKTLHFMVYFTILNTSVIAFFIAALYVKRLVENPEKFQLSLISTSFSLDKVMKVIGIIIAAIGGVIASETLLLAASGMKILDILVRGGPAFQDSASFFIIFLLITTAFFQIYCLNAGLKLADSIIVVPVFACTYNVFVMSNSLVYFNMFRSRSWWFYLVSGFGVLCLSFGIFILAHQDKQVPISVPRIQSHFLFKTRASSKGSCP